MKPTLFAGDPNAPLHVPNECCVAASHVKRILPTRCPGLPHGSPTSTDTSVIGHNVGCCNSRGWLYPDPPDWWVGEMKIVWDILERKGTKPLAEKRAEIEESIRVAKHAEWPQFCDKVWKAMGILEGE